MPVMLERWNDDKMDALEAKVDGLGGTVKDLDRRMEKGFERVDTELREQRQETSELRKDVKAGFERMLYAMLTATVLIIVAMIGAPHL